MAGLIEHSTSRALAAAAQQAAALEPDLGIETQLLDGSPAEVLVGAGQDASMLVLGSRGAGGFSAMILGSVSRYVATHAPVPVVVAREETTAEHREIVVGVRDPAHVRGRPGVRLRGGGAAQGAAARRARLVVVRAGAHGSARGGEHPTWRAR